MNVAERVSQSRLVQRNKVALQRAFARFGIDVHVRSDAPFDLLAFAKQRGAVSLLDVGANVGQFASAARRDGWQGSIVSFEPSSQGYANLARVAGSDPDWTTVNAAVGAEEGSIVLNVSLNSTSSSTLTVNERHVASASGAAIDHQETVRLVRLDDAVTEVGVKGPYLLKIDVQGAESSVIDGAHDVLEQAVVLQTEASLTPLYDGSVHWLDLARRVESLGFVVVDVEPAHRSPEGVLLQADMVFARPV